MRSASSPRAVSITIGTLPVSGLRRSRRQTSMPETLGSIQSSSTRSSGRSSAISIASSPSRASTTSNPSRSRL